MAAMRARPSLSARGARMMHILTRYEEKEPRRTGGDRTFAAAVWAIPAERMKRERRHGLPLVGRALEILEIIRIEQRSGAVFPGVSAHGKGQPMSEGHSPKMLNLMGDWRDEKKESS